MKSAQEQISPNDRSRGFANAYGVFQTYYETDLLRHESPSNISWIGSVQAFLLLLVGGLLTGPLFDAGYVQHLVAFGSFMVVFGMMMTSLCQTYWQVFLAQGITVGIGVGCLLIPSLAIVPQYFDKHRAFAMGVAISGSSIGESLIDRYAALLALIRRYRRSSLPHHLPPTAAKNRLPMDGTNPGLRCTRYTVDASSRNEAKEITAYSSKAVRLAGVQR